MSIRWNHAWCSALLRAGLLAAALLAGAPSPADAAVDRGQPTPAPAAPRDELLALERRTIDVFKQVSPSVVSVANRAVVRDLFSFQIYEEAQGTGSGFVWDKKGHIVSNFHVVYEASSIQVTLRDGTSYDAEVVGTDPDHDIAVLRIKAPESVLVPVKPGTSADLQVGQSVLAIGNPFGLDTSLSMGIVSALGRSIVSMTQRQIRDVIQTDAAINPGNSGGPLLDSAGRLIGINTAIISPSGGYAGVGFAVPVDTVRRIVPQLIVSGKVRRAGLGMQTLPDHIAAQSGVEGVAILKVPHGSAAAKAGLQGVRSTRDGHVFLGDVIVELDGVAIKNNDDFLAVLDHHQAGDSVALVYVREKKKYTVSITLQNVE